MTNRNFTSPRLSLVLALAVLLPLPLLLIACDGFEQDAYRALKLAKVEYELVQDHAARAFVRDEITAGQWDRFAAAGQRFIAAHTLAADLLEAYSRAKNADGGDNNAERARLRRQVQAALGRLPVLLGDLHQLLAAFDDSTPVAATTAAACPANGGGRYPTTKGVAA